MKKTGKFLVVISMLLMSLVTVTAKEDMQANLRKTGSFTSYSFFEEGLILVNEYVNWSVTYNAGSGEIVSCQATISIEPETVIANYGESEWQFSNISSNTLTPVISSGKGACTLGYSYTFSAKKFVNGVPVTKTITNTKRFDVTSEGLANKK